VIGKAGHDALGTTSGKGRYDECYLHNSNAFMTSCIENRDDRKCVQEKDEKATDYEVDAGNPHDLFHFDPTLTVAGVVFSGRPQGILHCALDFYERTSIPSPRYNQR
jgi:hypothetical protein